MHHEDIGGLEELAFRRVEVAKYLAGKISKEDLDCIFRKYGIA